MKEIRTDIFTFSDFIDGDLLYVDKTRFVWDLVKSKGIYFFSRPRRFGKSLLLSTFEAFFKNRRDLFKGLAIDSLAPEAAWKEHPIVHLDMAQADATDADGLRNSLSDLIRAEAEANGVELGDGTPKMLMGKLLAKSAAKADKGVVVLIDEYDHPILDAIGRSDLETVLNLMKGVYQEIKSANAIERFVFITGVTKFAHTSLFSGINNPTDITSDARFATLLGYTLDELKANFVEQIAATAKEKGITEGELLAKMEEWYDGFRFHAKAPPVFNPVSVGRFFASGGEFANYWYSTGTPKFLADAAKKKPFEIESYRNRPYSAISFDKYDPERVDPFVFMVQTGYLTIKGSRTIGDETEVYLDYPNREIRESFEKFLYGLYSGKTQSEVDATGKNLRDMLMSGDVDGFACSVKAEFASLPYENLGKPGPDPVKFYEGYFRNVMLALLHGASVDGRAEQQTAQGRIDLVAKFPSRTYVFELKTHGSETSSEAALDEAMAQARKKDYAASYSYPGLAVSLVAMSFDRDKREISGWRAVPVPRPG